MKSEGQQTDFIEQQRVIQAYKDAAEAALHDPYWPWNDRLKRSEHYRAAAERLEAML
jgi:hypothetical protein